MSYMLKDQIDPKFLLQGNMLYMVFLVSLGATEINSCTQIKHWHWIVPEQQVARCTCALEKLVRAMRANAHRPSAPKLQHALRDQPR